MSDDRDWREYTRRGALGLMGLGAGLAATETAGITSLTADRSTTLRFADDSTAMLGIEGDGKALNDPTDDNRTSFTSSPITITLTNRLGNAIPGGDLEVTITNSNTSTLTVENASNFIANSDTLPVDLSDSSGSSVTVTNDSQIGTTNEATFDLSTTDNLTGIELEVVRAETTNDETILADVTRTFDLDGSSS